MPVVHHRPGLSGSRQASCMACHPDGGNDGSAWGTMEGERRTLSLYGGVAGRGWLHQSGTHRDADEFVRVVVPERLGGAGLSDEDYEALANYLAYGIPRLQSPPVDEQAAERGGALFAQHCAACHSGETYSGGRPDSENPYGGGLEEGPLLVDVGTATDDARLILPSVFSSQFPPVTAQLYEQVRGDRDLGSSDPVQALLGFRPRPDRPRNQLRPPSLVNIWDNAVYFHDARFSELTEVVEYFNDYLNLELADGQVADLVAYLKTL